MLALLSPASGQTFQVLHNFAGQQDGNFPTAGVTIDRGGNLYGTTNFGALGYGGVYQLKLRNGFWSFSPLYEFTGAPDAFSASAPVTIGPNGTVYGAAFGGGLHNEGAIFNVTPPPTVCKTTQCWWKEKLPYSFNYTDGAGLQSAIVFDSAGNMYGAAPAGGNAGCMEGCGVVFKLVPSGGSWTETYYAFTGASDGGNPQGSVLLASDGNLYGTTTWGGAYGYGTVYELTPSGSGWTETTIHDFQNATDGSSAYAGLIEDASGNLYGAATYGGPNNAGTVFELARSNGGWSFTVLYAFPGQRPAGPFSNLVLAGGSLYGTTLGDGAHNLGSVFKLTPSNGSWTYTSLHDFTGGLDGGTVYGGVALDGQGNIYGTTAKGGQFNNCTQGCGVVWEITP